ncbi:MAG: single-stranded DNA-binding protein [Bacteroidales bacterium]|nr:single-stranded DNA-binding protein [Bacteroidales bacterium]MDY0216179.1 single-stranded DNA-binding protein [Bacteroidales bacterium]
MAGINKVILVGNLGKDPDTFTFEGGAKKVSFSLATTEQYKDSKGEKQKITEWHNIVCWRGLADIAEQFLRKGMQVYLEGKIRTRSWEDNGTKKYITEIVADNFQMLGSRADNENLGHNNPQNKETHASSAPTTQAESTAASQGAMNNEAQEEDDLPF